MTRREFDALPLTLLHTGRHWSKADVLMGEWPPASGRKVVVKDFRPRALWFRVLAGRAMMRREWRALNALRDVSGVPQPVARPYPDTLVMAHHAGRAACDFDEGQLPGGVLDRLEKLMNDVHARGVTNGDLHLNNVLVDDAGNVTLIDWATASTFGRRPRGVKAKAFDEWCALDRRTIAKLKALNAPHLLTEDEGDALLHGGTRLYRFVKSFRHTFDRLRGRQRERTVQNKYEEYLRAQAARDSESD
jgi:tRNA A-37 threonylcarbamoyl transferase component Bud32